MNLAGLKYIARISGCTVFDYSKSYNMLILFGLYEDAKNAKALAMVDGNGNKMIFIDDSMSEERQMFALAHELGHIVLEHTTSDSGRTQEDDANNFATLLLKAVSSVA